MIAKKIYFCRNTDGTFYVRCTLEVEGLGALEIADCISTETMESVCKEVEEQLRIRFGQRAAIETQNV